MTKEAEDEIKLMAEGLADAKQRKAEAEEVIKNAEKFLKKTMADEKLDSVVVGDWTVTIIKTDTAKIVDTDKLKKDGLFEKYSKDRAGSTQVRLANPNNKFLCDLEERRKKHIEDGKSVK